MRFYNRQYRHYCGIDLHVKTMYVCMLDATGQMLVHRNVDSTRIWRQRTRVSDVARLEETGMRA
jgi:hypothetical protein